MNEYLKLKKSNCKNCYKCIRRCSVKSIKFSDEQAFIVSDECILCGECFVVCPQNAKEIRSDISVAKELIANNGKVIASIAPSFVANYKGACIKSMESALKKLGFYCAQETALGATVVKKQYESIIRSGEKDVVISSCCHSVNLLIQKYYPDALPYLADVISPMAAHCKMIKEKYEGAKTVFIGPCISKKSEGEQYKEYVDCVLTFEELTQWLSDENIVIESGNDENEFSRARLFPTAGGILRTMDCHRSDYSYISVDGLENCINAIKDITSGKPEKCFIEMSACSGSCIGGPVMDKEYRSPVRDYMAVDAYAGKEDFITNEAYHIDLKRKTGNIGLSRKMPGAKSIQEVLIKMGKTKPEHELNCGTCGYNTCRDKAVAVILGKADLSMCLPFLKEKAESFSDNIIKNTPNGIIVLDAELKVQQINKSALDIMNIRDASDVIGKHVVCILEPDIFEQVYKTEQSVHEKRIFLAEYGKYVDQTVILDKSYQIIICIMRDVTVEEMHREKKEKNSIHTIEVTDRVIEKQMRVVQEIASLLGETTAETKIALTKLKESISGE